MLPDTNEPFNIFQDEKKYCLWQEKFAEDIRQRKSAYSIACLVKTCYKPLFFESSKEYLSEKDFASILVDYWAACGITDVSKIKFLSWFQEAKKAFLMSKSEQKKFDKLPEKVTIYRGVNGHEDIYGFSWTIDKRIADWFANRYDNKESYVFECIVDKKDILCYLEIRDEKEVIIAPEVLKKYEIKTYST